MAEFSISLSTEDFRPQYWPHAECYRSCIFNTFQQSWKVFMHLVCLSVCVSLLHTKKTWNKLTPDIRHAHAPSSFQEKKFYLEHAHIVCRIQVCLMSPWCETGLLINILQMVYVWLMVCLQRHAKVFGCITAYGGKSLKRI